ncbi:MAG: glycerol kinase GlpK [Alphaproteobacteria bacterium]
MAADHILAIDEGTTSTRALVFDRSGRVVAVAQRELHQHYPHPGWVEHDAEEIWAGTLQVARDVLAKAGLDESRIAAIGITNQRETTIVWDRRTGEPIHRAIVWQDRRTAEDCARLKADGIEPLVRAKTGLLLDPYFSATKIAWILEHVAGAREAAERGDLAFGTVDCFLLWRLTRGAVHATDATNASRTLLYDIRAQRWDEELCELFRVPPSLLPEVRDNAGDFGSTAPGILDRPVPISGMAGDQQSALVGQACFDPGMAKVTYGTGCFLLSNTGREPLQSKSGLLTTIGYRLDGQTTYAAEGSTFIAGAAIKWLRDGLGLIASAEETAALATSVPDSHGVYLVPAFVGLGAPHWDPDARAAIFGLTLGAGRAHLARAALEAVVYQTRDLVEAIVADGGAAPAALRIDGGMAANDWLCQFLADILDVRVQRPVNVETTALGAAFLAGLGVGLWSGIEEIARTWRARDEFSPAMDPAVRARLLQGWDEAVSRTLSAAR